MAHDIYKFSFNEIYQIYIAKAKRKNRTIDEVDTIINWLTGYSVEQIKGFDDCLSLEGFFTFAPLLNPNRTLITGSICGVKVQEIQDSTMKEIRYLDKLIDELYKGKALEKILRK